MIIIWSSKMIDEAMIIAQKFNNEAGKMKLFVNINIFKEDEVYVALAPELNVSSFGESADDAQNSLREALEAFIEECDVMGTLEEVLEESGFLKHNDLWEPRKPVAQSVFALAV